MEATGQPVLRWGIIGTGGIAATFARDLQLLSDARTVAVGSRAQAGADRFADRFHIPARHGSYEQLVNDPDVDAVYVATPHPGHHAATRLALEAGKPVLCEKVFTINQAEAADLVALARSRNLFLMEAMWTRFLPHIKRVRDLIQSGVIGEITTLIADHGQWFAYNPEHRIFAPELGGGALLDLGIYPVSFASYLLGTPMQIMATSDPAPTGVDGQTSMLFRYESGAHAVLTTTSRAFTSNRATIVGTNGRIEIDATWYAPATFTLTRRSNDRPEQYVEPRVGQGLRHQAIEVARCLREGLLESPVMPLDETVSIMGTVDEVRRQIGLRYPSESGAAS